MTRDHARSEHEPVRHGPPVGARSASPDHPMANLQRSAGNRATTAMVAALQRAAGTQARDDQFKAIATGKSESVQGDDPRLQIVAKEHAERVIRGVQPVAGTITAALEVIAAANGGKLEGLEYNLKSVDSLQRKLADLARTRVKSGEGVEAAVAAEAANTKDALRYTITVPPDAYAALADTKLRDALADKGATRIKAANAWADPEGSYKGFNSAYEVDSPGGGRVKFEVQIHTPASWEMKSEMHKQYEDARKDTRMSNAAKTWLNNYMTSRWKSVKVPDGMAGYDAKMNKR